MSRADRSIRARPRGSGHRALELEWLERRVLLDAPSPVIQQMVDAVTGASYTDYLAALTDFPDRNSYTENFGLAADYIVGELEALGLQVELREFALPSATPIDWNEGEYWAPVSNIVATIPGKVTPEQQYVLAAHYDSIAVNPQDYTDAYQMITDMLGPSTPAPGADDNASGTAAVLESARVLSEYPFESTIKFVLFGAEEQGLVGSDYYTRYAFYEDSSVDAYYEDPAHDPSILIEDPDDVRGAINYDMIAYWDADPAGGESLDVVGYTGQTYDITTYPNLMEIIEQAAPDLTPEQVEWILASLLQAIPPPPVDSVDSSALASAFVNASSTYGTGLEINYIEAGGAEDWWLVGPTSDHFNFWWYGWPALLCVEDMVSGIDPATGYPYVTVTNPHYHSSEDSFENANATDMAAAATRTGVATIAELAGVRVGVLDGGFGPGALEATYSTEGDVSLVEIGPGNYAAQLEESSSASLSQQMVLPADADALEFDFRFLAPGDGDFLTVEFAGNEVFRLVGTDVGDSEWHSAQVDVSAYSGQPGTLSFVLNSVGDPNAQYQIDNIEFASLPAGEVTGVWVGRGDDRDLPVGGDPEYDYWVEVAGYELTGLEVATPWDEDFDSDDYLPPGWAGEDYEHETADFGFWAGTDGGERWLEVEWSSLTAGEWASLETADTGITAYYADGSWSGSVDFGGAPMPTQVPNITYPAHLQADVPLMPTFQWDEWTSPGPGAGVWHALEGAGVPEGLYEVDHAPADTTGWAVPAPLEPGTQYDFAVDFHNQGSSEVGGVEVWTHSYLEAGILFTTATPGVTGLWVDRGHDHNYPGAGDEQYVYCLEVAGFGLTGLELAMPWGEAFDSDDYLPPGWAGEEFSYEDAGFWFWAGTEQDGQRSFEVEWEGLTDPQWAALDAGITGVVAAYVGGSWTGMVDFAGVPQPVQVPQMVYPAHGQTGVALLPMFQWDQWTSPGPGAGVWFELGRAGTEDTLYEEEHAPADTTSWTPPQPLEANTEYEWAVDFHNAAESVVNGADVSIASWTESDVLFTTATALREWRSGEVLVSVYDMVGEQDIDPDDVLVRFGRNDTVRAVLITGTQPMDGLAITISGANSVGAIRDLRRGAPGDVAFIASDAPVRAAIFRSGIGGYMLNGAELGGLNFGADIDGDGRTDDATGFYAAGPVRSLVVRGDVDGDVVVGGDLNALLVLGGDLNGDVVLTGSRIGRVVARARYDRGAGEWIGGDIAGDIRVGLLLSGRYNLVDFFHDAPAGGPAELEADAGYVTLDGAGNWTAVIEVEAWDGPGETDSGTYAFDAHGRLIVDGVNTYGMVSPNGEVLVVPDLDPEEDDALGITFLVKSSPDLTAADLSGRYNLVSFSHDVPLGGPQELGTYAGYVTFDGEGNWTYVPEVEAWGGDGEIGSGTYAVDELGRLIIDGADSYGMVSPNGEMVIVPDLDPEEGDDLGISFLVKSGPDLAEADLFGRYNFANFFHDAPAHDGRELETAAGYVRLDGVHRWFAVEQREAWGGGGGRDSGTYAIGEHGRFIEDGVQTYGMASPNGEIVIVPDLDPDEDDDLGIAFALKSTSAFEPGRIGAVVAVGGQISGDVTATGGVGSVTARAVYDRPAQQWRGGAVAGDLEAGGGLRRVFVGDDLTGDLTVRGNLRSVAVRGSVVGSRIDVTAGNFGSFRIGGELNNAAVEVEGLFRRLWVGEDAYNSSVHARRLGRTIARGDLYGDDTDGDLDEIHADEGRFYRRAQNFGGGWVWEGDVYWRDGVKVWVG